MKKLYLIRGTLSDEYDLIVWATSPAEVQKLWEEYYEIEDTDHLIHEIPTLDQSVPARALEWDEDIQAIHAGEEHSEDE